jgi:hypothetical protein
MTISRPFVHRCLNTAVTGVQRNGVSCGRCTHCVLDTTSATHSRNSTPRRELHARRRARKITVQMITVLRANCMTSAGMEVGTLTRYIMARAIVQEASMVESLCAQCETGHGHGKRAKAEYGWSPTWSKQPAHDKNDTRDAADQFTWCPASKVGALRILCPRWKQSSEERQDKRAEY